MRTERVAVGLVSVVVLVSVSLGGTAAVPTPAAQQGPRTVEDAPSGTIFTTVIRNGERVGGPVGILKRGRTGGALYNPATDAVSLRPGDVLVDREGRQYRMTIPQNHPGSAGVVGSGATLYPGETDLWFVGFADPRLDRFPQRVGGDELLLDGGVPADQPAGIYRDETVPTREVLDVEERLSPQLRELTVRTPRVTDLRVVDGRGRTVEPGSTVPADGFVVVSARVNFLDAERAQVHLFDPATETAITRGALSRATAIARFPERAGFIERTVPAGKARLEGPDGSIRSLANEALQPTTTVYLVQDLGVVEAPTTLEAVVAADTHGPFGDLYSTGVRRSLTFSVEPTAAAGTATAERTTAEPTPASPTPTTTTTTTTATTTVTTTDQPGFGVLVALVALLLAALVARLRAGRED